MYFKPNWFSPMLDFDEIFDIVPFVYLQLEELTRFDVLKVQNGDKINDFWANSSPKSPKSRLCTPKCFSFCTFPMTDDVLTHSNRLPVSQLL